jgi:hypothetical protein
MREPRLAHYGTKAKGTAALRERVEHVAPLRLLHGLVDRTLSTHVEHSEQVNASSPEITKLPASTGIETLSIMRMFLRLPRSFVIVYPIRHVQQTC